MKVRELGHEWVNRINDDHERGAAPQMPSMGQRQVTLGKIDPFYCCTEEKNSDLRIWGIMTISMY